MGRRFLALGVADVRVTAGSAAITGWTVTWTFANGQSVSQAWSATVTRSGENVTAVNMGYKRQLRCRCERDVRLHRVAERPRLTVTVLSRSDSDFAARPEAR